MDKEIKSLQIIFYYNQHFRCERLLKELQNLFRMWLLSSKGMRTLPPAIKSIRMTATSCRSISDFSQPIKPPPPKMPFGLFKTFCMATSGSLLGAYIATYLAGILENFESFSEEMEDDEDY